MKIHEFIQLDMHQKAEVAWSATFLADRTDKEDNILLFSMGDFFVEIYYNTKDKELLIIINILHT